MRTRMVGRPAPICAKRPTCGTPPSMSGYTSRAPRSRGSVASMATTSAWLNRTRPTPRHRRRVSCQSRTAALGEYGPRGADCQPDALALVRFGVRAPDDPRIVNTVKVIDSLLRVDTPRGPAWRRYNGDGYGEHEDGSPFDGTGIGRVWPLLTGERAHYELAAGRRQRAEELARTMEACAGDSLLLPEQVWDAPDIPERELRFGEASGSARPLVWAHAEYVKLRRSIEDGRVFDQPPQTVQRYLIEGRANTPYVVWRFNNKIRTMPPGKILRVETLARATVHWGINEWSDVVDAETVD